VRRLTCPHGSGLTGRNPLWLQRTLVAAAAAAVVGAWFILGLSTGSSLAAGLTRAPSGYRIHIHGPSSVVHGQPFTISVSGSATEKAAVLVVLDPRPCAASGSQEVKRNALFGAIVRNVDGRFQLTLPSKTAPGTRGRDHICAYLLTRNGDHLVTRARLGSTYTVTRATWLGRHHVAPSSLSGISCASSSLCVALDTYSSTVYISTDPGDGPSASWATKVLVPPSGGESLSSLRAVDCPSASLCVAVEGDTVFTTTDAFDGASSSWQSAEVSVASQDSYPELQGISCPSVSFCIAVGNGVYASTDPEDGASATWAPSDPDSSGDPLGPISCASVALCVASDSEGYLITSTGPSDGVAARWTRQVVLGLVGISCPSMALCAGVEGEAVGSGYPWLTTDPLKSPSANWGPSQRIPAPADFSALSCPSAALCLATTAYPSVGAKDSVFTSIKPQSNSKARWSINTFAGYALGDGPTAVSCSSTTFCAVADSEGSVFTTRYPGDG
jgi:hypothetical protein